MWWGGQQGTATYVQNTEEEQLNESRGEKQYSVSFRSLVELQQFISLSSGFQSAFTKKIYQNMLLLDQWSPVWISLCIFSKAKKLYKKIRLYSSFSLIIVILLFLLVPFKPFVLGPTSSLKLLQLIKSHDDIETSDVMLLTTSVIQGLFDLNNHRALCDNFPFFCRLVWEINLLTVSELLLKCHATSYCSQTVSVFSIPHFAARSIKC